MQLCKICRHCGLCPGDGKQSFSKDMQILTKGNIPLLQDIKDFSPKDLFFAADIGTTTLVAVAAHLVQQEDSYKIEILCTKSCPNPQMQYGRDVLSRITAARNPEVLQTLLFHHSVHQGIPLNIQLLIHSGRRFPFRLVPCQNRCQV